jgi:molybdopterin-guanine dinucleotide biosynthesis protein A
LRYPLHRVAVDTALILAGGASSRFRGFKALQEIAGTPMIRRVVDAMAPLAGEVLVCVADETAADAMRPVLPAVTFVSDRHRGIGPVEGLRRGAEAAHGDRLFVAPCDAPLLRTDLYRLLGGALEDHQAAVPRIDVFDPIRAVYRTSAVRGLLEKGREGLRSPSAIVDRLDAVFVEAEQLRSIDPRLDSFLDVNTRRDLDEVVLRLHAPGP